MGERFGIDDSPVSPQRGGTGKQRPDGEMLDLDRVYAVLGYPRRRMVLDIVTENDPVTTRDLATAIAARENDVPRHAVTDEQRRSVVVALYHVHIPKLADADVLTVEDGFDSIRCGPNADQVLAAAHGLVEQFQSSH